MSVLEYELDWKLYWYEIEQGIVLLITSRLAAFLNLLGYLSYRHGVIWEGPQSIVLGPVKAHFWSNFVILCEFV